MLRYYQHAAHVQAALLVLLFGLAEETSVTVVNALYLAAFPVSIFWCARKLGFSRVAGTAAAVLVAFIEGDKGSEFKHLFGMQLRCFTWEGWGLFTQTVAIVWMCISYGQTYEYVTTGRGFYLATAAIACTWLSHLIVGYGVSVLTVVFVLAKPGEWRSGLKRWALVNAVAALSISYLTVPTLLEKYILNRSVFEPAEYWDSYGFYNVVRYFWRGLLLDSLRERSYPWFTYWFMASLVYLALQWRRLVADGTLRVAALCFVGAFLLFCGRHTFGPLVHLMPFSHNLPFHRFYVQFHLWALLLSGWMVSEMHKQLVELVGKWSARKSRVVAGVATTPPASAASPPAQQSPAATVRDWSLITVVVSIFFLLLLAPAVYDHWVCATHQLFFFLHVS